MSSEIPDGDHERLIELAEEVNAIFAERAGLIAKATGRKPHSVTASEFRPYLEGEPVERADPRKKDWFVSVTIWDDDLPRIERELGEEHCVGMADVADYLMDTFEEHHDTDTSASPFFHKKKLKSRLAGMYSNIIKGGSSITPIRFTLDNRNYLWQIKVAGKPLAEMLKELEERA